MKTKTIHKINRIKQFLTEHQKCLQLIVIFAIALRFVWLNAINWHTGEISNGLPGIKYWLDSNRYLFGAERVLSGEGLEGRQFQFLGYILIIAFLKLFSLPDGAIIILQLGLAGFAAFALFDTVKTGSKSKLAGLFAIALFLCNPFIVKWHLYILTESIYTSMVIIFFWRLVKMIKKHGFKNVVFAGLMLIITMFIRPNGWILIPVFFGFLINTFLLNKYLKKSLIVISLFAFVLLMGAVGSFRNSIQITTPVENLQAGITVWGHPELNLEMPQAVNLDSDDWVGGLKYIIRYPFASVKLASVRVGYTLMHIRSYHSSAYKLRVLFWIIPAYLLSIFSLQYIKRKPEILAGLLIIFAHLFVIAVSYAEHDSRFDIYITPIFYMLAGFGLCGLISFCKKRRIFPRSRFWNS
ncbi:MAG: hypothetical protein PF448_07755 [Bacteroidales bacterium]|jgi:hypothetical protein|nr:hypothetical protein [Bacteroidales bacterium]